MRGRRGTLVALALAATLVTLAPAQSTEASLNLRFDGTDAAGYHITGDMRVQPMAGGLKWFGAAGAGRTVGCLSDTTKEGFACSAGYTSDVHLPPVTDCHGGTRLDWGRWDGGDDRRYNIDQTTELTSLAQIGSIAIHKTAADGTRGPLMACAVPVVSR